MLAARICLIGLIVFAAAFGAAFAQAQLVSTTQPAFAQDFARNFDARQAVEQVLNRSVYSTLDPASPASAFHRMEERSRPAGQAEAQVAGIPAGIQTGRRTNGVDDSQLAQARSRSRDQSMAYLRAGGHAMALEASRRESAAP